ncbi:unnamed protein product [Rangifer tarandus platyrhynchus]|uniref:Uncharacterized protein n=1 Tax=Rangifer tarandus platyrhynchus TaxID=3082113 RepID=A0ACB1KDH7_RANTA
MNQIIECSSSEVTVTAHIKARWIKGLKETGRWQKSNPRATTVSGHINYRLQGACCSGKGKPPSSIRAHIWFQLESRRLGSPGAKSRWQRHGRGHHHPYG